MSAGPETPVKDKNYDLLSVVQASLQNVWQMETYIADAERQQDAELAKWFSRIKENNQKAAEQGKQLLRQRLEEEGG